MATDDLTALDAASLSERLGDRTVSCVEAMQAYLDRIARRNPELNAIVSLRDEEQLIDEARRCDHELSQGRRRGWMHGLPQAIKDLSETKDLTTTFGSPLFRDNVPTHDALMVERMRAAGCVIVGKTNTPEFGKGSHTFNEVFGVTRNAYDPDRSAGGSSGGAAVALATRMLPVADGSDYMGSLRNPAAWNNVFGFRPSEGRVPGYPARDQFFSQMGTEGPMGRTVLDVMLLFATQAGRARIVPQSLDGNFRDLTDVAAARAALAGSDPRGIRIGWLGDLDGYLAVDAGILDRCIDGLRRLESLGCRVAPASFGVSLAEVWHAWLVLRNAATVGAFGPGAFDPLVRAQLKPEILWEIDEGATLSAADVVRATEIRTRFYTAVEALYGQFDVLALPTAQVWPFPAAERWPTHVGGREMDTYHRWMEVTLYATFAGLPTISVPVGFGPGGLPMGMQLMGAPRADLDVLLLAAAYESTIGDFGVGAA